MFRPRPSMGVSRPSMSRAWGNLNMVGAVTRGLGRLSIALPSPGVSPGRIAAAAEPPAGPVTPPPLPEEAALASGAAALAAVDVGSSGGLYMAPGAEAAIEEAQRAAAQARQRALEADADGALQILRKLMDLPSVREYNALRAAIHNAKAIAFLTQQCMGLGLGYVSGTGFLIRRLPSSSGPWQPSWSAPSYYRCHGLCIGVLAGYEYVQQLVCIHSDRLLEQFVSGEFHAGLDATLLAGGDLPRDMAARPSRIDFKARDAQLCFSLAGGAFASLSVQVGWSGADKRMNQSLFGELTLFGPAEPVQPRELLGGSHAAPDPPREFDGLYRLLDKLSMTWRPLRRY
ncbi:hypothetical protein ABPG77_007601 [Micractinium sp. CCAP 211/92]